MADNFTQDEVRCVVPAGDICGEGAVWNPEHGALYWTDINRFLLHKFIPEAGTTRTWLFDEPVTSVNLTTDADKLLLVLGSKTGIWTEAAHPQIDVVYRLAEAPAMRFNDARVDPRGRLWAGTMRNNVGPRGEDLEVAFADAVLYRIDPDGEATKWKTGIGISNTLAWSPDRRTFYFGDTPANTIYAFDYDEQQGAISGERTFFHGQDGVPDGSAMDAEGYLWNTRPHAGTLARIAPDGRVDRTVPLPVTRPTTCTFGGPKLETLYITSARSGEQLSGSLFALDLVTGGLPEGRFCLSTSRQGDLML
jgi:sugar lactone lactonase YvrE